MELIPIPGLAVEFPGEYVYCIRMDLMVIMDEQGDDGLGVTHLLTIKEFAEYVRLSPATIHRYVKSGDIESYRMGLRNIRIPLAELPKFLEKSAKTADSSHG